MASLPDLPDDLFGVPAPGPKWGFLPPVWFGMPLVPWLRLLVRYRFRVSPRHWLRALSTTLIAPLNSLLGCYTTAIYGWRLARTQVTAPLFVVGHWRSGTTLLHELLALDPRHAWPDGYACFCPVHFRRTRYVLRALLAWAVPKQRPMDSMAFDLALPQEDEFALLFMGAPSPYESLAFPFASGRQMTRLDPALLDAREQARFDRAMRRFFASVMLGQEERRLVLKSPPHMGRLETLARLYPKLKVVHIVRDPRAVIPSMIKMMTILGPLMQLNGRLPEQPVTALFRNYALLFERFQAGRAQLPPDALVEIRYEDLVADPIAVLRDLYARLDLGDFAPLEQALCQQVEAGRFRRASLPPLTAAQRQAIEAYGADTLRRYGYL